MVHCTRIESYDVSMKISACIGLGVAIAMSVGFVSAQDSPLAWAETLEASPSPAVITDDAIRARIVATGLPWRVRERVSGIEMLLVPPGAVAVDEIAAGGDAASARPTARVIESAAPFYLGRTEITQEQWTHLMGVNPSAFQASAFHAAADEKREVKIKAIMDGGYTRQEANAKIGSVQVEKIETKSWPVDSLSPEEIQSFLLKCELRLPTESEWEYACRATATGDQSGELDAVAWFGANSSDHPHDVATKRANAFGFHDMLGNVWEWCSDSFIAGESHALRGGNWLSLPTTCRASARIGAAVGRPAYGVRVARNP